MKRLSQEKEYFFQIYSNLFIWMENQLFPNYVFMQKAQYSLIFHDDSEYLHSLIQLLPRIENSYYFLDWVDAFFISEPFWRVYR